MLAKRIIPCLDVNQGRVVKGKKFLNLQDVADPVVLAKQYSDQGADELVFYDITASSDNRDIFLNIVQKVAAEITIPFTVGGGIRTVEDARRALRAGADKVSINSAAVKNPSLLTDVALKFGSQCVVLSIDAKTTEKSEWSVFLNGGRVNSGFNAVEWAAQGEKLGAGEIVINAMDVDGVKEGFHIPLTRQIAETVNIPIVASGGAGSMEHFTTILTDGKADAALAASVFHYGEIQLPTLKDYLIQNNIAIRSV